jgi:phytoene/squalene synthetase
MVNQSRYNNYDALENYAEFGQSALLYSQLEILGITTEEVHYVASHIGVATGLTNVIRSHAYHARQVSCSFQYSFK